MGIPVCPGHFPESKKNMGKERKIYLIRHGEVYEDGEVRRCLGHTDVPMTKRGERQAEKTAKWFWDKDIAVIYSSPLQRCVRTAQAIKEQKEDPGIGIRILNGLKELDAGTWENLSFEKIRREYPKEYEARGRELGYYAFPEGESFYQAGIRFGRCLEGIRKEMNGDILIVTHAGVVRGYLSSLSGISPNDVFAIVQPCAGITILRETDTGLTPEKIGWRPPGFLDREEMQYLYHKCKTSERTVCHMEAVARFTGVLERKMKYSDHRWNLLRKAALVHDICRAEREHAKAGADVLRKEGYWEIAKLVERHHSSEDTLNEKRGGMSVLSEEDLLFYADKRVYENQIVSLDDRFRGSMQKCKTPEAKEKHQRLYEKAKNIEKRIEKFAGGEGI